MIPLSLEQEQRFDTLIEEVEEYARKYPQKYRRRVALLAMLGYGYFVAVFILICFILWIIRQAILLTNPAMLGQLNQIFLYLGFGILGLFFTYFPKPNGIKLYRQQVPELFNLIDELTSNLKAPKFHHILLTDDLNAGVFQRPYFGFIGWQENYLLLGLPLMQALSVEQFRAVVAHELGHLSGNHSRFSGWIYRVRKLWHNLAQKSLAKKRGTSFIFTKFFDWYEPFFKAYTFVLARFNEYEADSCAAEQAGVINKAEALINITVISHFLTNSFWPKIYQQVSYQTEPPNDVISQLIKELKTDKVWENAQETLEFALLEMTDNEDTHPCLQERLTALGYVLDLDNWSKPIIQRAAFCLLGNQLERLTKQLDQYWQKNNQQLWQEKSNIIKQQQRNLQRLETKQQKQTLTVEETWKYAYLIEKLEGSEAAILKYKEVLRQNPKHAVANYQLGKHLIKNADSSGIYYLQNALNHDPFLKMDCYETLAQFYQKQGQEHKAREYQTIKFQYEAIYQKAVLERSQVNENATFFYHQLPQSEIEQLAEQLASIPEVRQAYFVQQSVTIFPEKPFYVLAILRRFVPGQNAPYQTDLQLAKLIETELNFSDPIKVIIFQSSSHQLSQKITRLKQARIYLR